MSDSKQFEFLSNGFLANEFAETAYLVRKDLDAHRREALVKVERHRLDKPIPPQAMIIAWIALAAWAICTYVEYTVSAPIYGVCMGVAEDSIMPITIVVTIALVAVIISALIAEIYHPVFTKYFSKSTRDPYRQAIMNRNRKPVDRRYISFGLGLLALAIGTAVLYYFSLERIRLEQLAGEGNGESGANEFLASILFIVEVVSGMSIPFVGGAVWYRASTSTARRRDKNLDRRYNRLVTKSLEFYGTSVYQREESELTAAPAPISHNLRKLIVERFGVESEENQTQDQTPTMASTNPDDVEPTVAVEVPTQVSPDLPASTIEADGAAENSADEVENETDDEAEEDTSQHLRIIDELINRSSSEL